MRIVTKIRGSMWWMAVLVTTLVSIGPGALSFAGAEEGLDPAVNVSSGPSGLPSAAAVPDEAPPTAPLGDAVPARDTAEATPGGPQEGWNPVEASSFLSESPRDAPVSDEAPLAMPVSDVVPDEKTAEETRGAPQVEPAASEDYDPWEPFNERMFTFNRELDRYVLKPVATGWDTVVPNAVQRGLGRMLDNVGMPRRFVNSLLQGKVEGAGQELARFLLNSTFGLAGFFDVATEAGLQASDKDTGQTLGVWGVPPGPYLVLPFLPPMTVRDGIGSGVDALLNPAIYFAPVVAMASVKATDTVNDRSLNLEVFEHVEEGTIDMYSAVRNAYLQRREHAVRE